MRKVTILFLMFILQINVFAANEETNNSRSGHYLVLGYDIVSSGIFTGGTSTDSSSITVFDSKINFEKGYTVGYEYRDTKSNGWGKAFSLLYGLKRGVETFKIDGVTYKTTTSDVAKVTMLSLIAAGVYRWENFYLSVGGGFSRIEYTPPSTYIGETSSNGGFGILLGMGWEFNEKICLEYMVRNSLWDLTTETDSSKTDYGTGTFGISSLALKYKFY